jgi:hypothetical protein
VIKPEPSRHVHFIPATDDSGGGCFQAGKPHAGVIAFVHSDRLVNLMAIDSNGHPVSRTSVTLVQPEDEAPSAGDYCRWMPYTVQTAAKQ